MDQPWLQLQLHNLKQGIHILKTSATERRMPDFPHDVMHTMLLSWGVANLLLMVMVPKVRGMIFQTLEAIITIALLLLLIGVVLAMPVGVVYLSYRGSVFLLQSLTSSFPVLRQLVNKLHTLVAATISK